jgi:hypothetical protein
MQAPSLVGQPQSVINAMHPGSDWQLARVASQAPPPVNAPIWQSSQGVATFVFTNDSTDETRVATLPPAQSKTDVTPTTYGMPPLVTSQGPPSSP